MLNGYKSGVIAGQYYNVIGSISTNTTNLNVYNKAKALGWNGVERLRMLLTIEPGVTVSSNDATLPAILVFSFRDAAYDDLVTIINNGNIHGGGGANGVGGTSATKYAGSDGQPGGTAILATTTCTIINNGTVYGGGGGGGGSGGIKTTSETVNTSTGYTCGSNSCPGYYTSGGGTNPNPAIPATTYGTGCYYSDCYAGCTCYNQTHYNCKKLHCPSTTFSNGIDGTDGNADTGTGTTANGKGGQPGYPGNPGAPGSFLDKTLTPPVTVTFTDSLDWLVPAGVTNITVVAVGGGGGGGGGTSHTKSGLTSHGFYIGAGGGSGGYSSTVVSVTPGQTISVKVGAAGAAGYGSGGGSAPGKAGGDSGVVVGGVNLGFANGGGGGGNAYGGGGSGPTYVGAGGSGNVTKGNPGTSNTSDTNESATSPGGASVYSPYGKGGAGGNYQGGRKSAGKSGVEYSGASFNGYAGGSGFVSITYSQYTELVDATGGKGGAAGKYIDGSSYITNFSDLKATDVKGNYV